MSLTEDLWDEDGFQGVPAEPDPQVIYDRLVTLVMRQGNWLSSPEAQLLPTAEWERQFARYQEQLEELRRLVPHDEQIQRAVSEICGRNPKLVDHQRQRSMCDPWVIALAQVHKMTVVTEETSKPTRPRIPDVCRAEDIPCINLLTMMRELGWKFRV